MRCLSLDLEVGRRSGRIHSLAAVWQDTGEVWTRTQVTRARLGACLEELDRIAAEADCLLGHNLVAFDLPHLEAAAPGLGLLRLPVIDTLRLSPLAFPANPYHRLVKHNQDGDLVRGQRNDPAEDARSALGLFADERAALARASPDLCALWHWLVAAPADDAAANAAANAAAVAGIDGVFVDARGGRERPVDAEARAALARLLDGKACTVAAGEVVDAGANPGWSLAYALAWLSVAEGNSVMPPWVRHQFPEAGRLVRRLRDEACTDPACHWCRDRHDAIAELRRWFGFDAYRAEPATADGGSMQQAIVEAAMRGRHVLGLLPTGAGKSLCYQVPSLARFDRTGALAVVISPLVALMADQVRGLEAQGIASCVAINGLLSMPERAEALDRVRLGDASIVLVSPEQLRSKGFVRVLEQREIGAWVLDEAHCLSRWGHDFRPDYRYIGRFIRERTGDGVMAPLMCLTATAKPDVVRDIQDHFRRHLDIELDVFDGGAQRENLEFVVMATEGERKNDDIHTVLDAWLPADSPGGAIVYCATRRHCEAVAGFLARKGVAAGHFHAGLPPETKKDTQRRFIDGDLRVIAATNAFGMGIDKPDVRLVIHADIPGSLENYLQEAGRAGRDREPARCVLLYTPDDVERQFGMSARSRLSRREIHGILRALRNIDRKGRLGGEVVATSGEILLEDDEDAFERDSATDDTRVRTAVAWLEEATLLAREANEVRVFPSSLRVESVDEARERLAGRASLTEERRRQLLRIVAALIAADRDEGLSTDDLMGVAGLGPAGIRAALHDLETLGLATNDMALTAFVHAGVARSSERRLAQAAQLEAALIDTLREAAPDLEPGQSSVLHLRAVSQALRDADLADPLPERLVRMLRSISQDGRGDPRADGGSGGSIDLGRNNRETVTVTLRRAWRPLARTAELRRGAARVLLNHLTSCLPAGRRGTDLLAETTLGALRGALAGDLEFTSGGWDLGKLVDRALLWLHEQEVIRLNRGLTVFRPAMTIRLGDDDRGRSRRGFSSADFEPLAVHYQEQTLQVHIMAEFANRGLEATADALRLAMDYFHLERDAFLARWLPGRASDLARETSPASWRAIVESLSPPQRRIVADNRERGNVLVLAGPGSGKTRVLVHRIAYLLRARRERAQSILALAYNRHAAVQIRQRLSELVGDDARGVTVLTCHALAMRLVGASFASVASSGEPGRGAAPGKDEFRQVLREAAALLQGNGLAEEEADAWRDRLLAGFRWILVDEYQDIDRDQYDLISALAGRTLEDEERKLSLFAVGDDDQNIYAFDGASVEFIRRFQADYGARDAWLTENFRSTGHIVEAANAFIAPARARMKSDHPIAVDAARNEQPAAGAWAAKDPVGRGQVQVLACAPGDVAGALTALAELRRLAKLAGDAWDWSKCAVIARHWRALDPLMGLCECHDIPYQVGRDDSAFFWRLRETVRLRAWLQARQSGLVDAGTIRAWVAGQPEGAWMRVLAGAADEFALEAGDGETSIEAFAEWLAEWGRELRRRQAGLLLVSAHRAKGLEFEHVVVLDDDWQRTGRGEDLDAWRRLYYVAMTRARSTLALVSRSARLPADGVREPRPRYGLPPLGLLDNAAVALRQPPELPAAPPEAHHLHRTLTPADVDLGFAGRLAPGAPAHAAIASVQPGDALAVRTEASPWVLETPAGVRVGRLARAHRPEGERVVSARVHAIVTWRREDSPPEYRESLRHEAWEAVLPELVLE